MTEDFFEREDTEETNFRGFSVPSVASCSKHRSVPSTADQCVTKSTIIVSRECQAGVTLGSPRDGATSPVVNTKSYAHMKNKLFSLPRTALCLLTLHNLLATPATAQVASYDVNVQTAQFLLYTDPYNGNQVRVGGFSGLYPVPGQPD